MSDGSKLRQFLKIMEGELIPSTGRTLKIDTDPYVLYRTLLRMPSPENYTEPDGNNMKGQMTFWDPVSYEEAKRKFDKFGIKYTEQDPKMTNVWDSEREQDDTFNVSPYVNNQATGNDAKEWKDAAPTSRGPKVAQGVSDPKPVKNKLV